MRFVTSIFIVVFVFIKCENPSYPRLEENPYVSYHYLTSAEKGAYLKFAVIMPESYAPDSTYPVLLTFPPGDQCQEMGEWALEKYWITSSIQKNWIVVSPISPNDTLFDEGAEKHIPNLMQWINGNFNVEGNKFHVAGVSSGGRSAFRIALDYTVQIQSVTVLPGYPPLSIDYTHLDRLKYIPVTMFVGEYDESFLNDMVAAYNRLKEIGAKWVRLEIMSNEEHVIESLTSERLFQILENARPKI